MERCSQSPEGLDFLAAHLTPEQFRRLVNYEWAVAARDDQLAPVLAKGGGGWHTWLLLGGRGSGKTRAGAEWVRAQAIGEPPLADRRSRRIALIGDTIAQVRSIMIEGVSGLMSIYPPDKRPKLEVSKNQLVWESRRPPATPPPPRAPGPAPSPSTARPRPRASSSRPSPQPRPSPA